MSSLLEILKRALVEDVTKHGHIMLHPDDVKEMIAALESMPPALQDDGKWKIHSV
jgi:hypothetical protein